jgi:hypothetical protein
VNLMNRPIVTICLLGILFSLVFGRLSVREHRFVFDGKLFYIGAKLLVAGQNPYRLSELREASRRYAPEGFPAGIEQQAQMHLPATLAAFALFCWMPWTAFCWFLDLLNAFCLPLIAYLLLEYLTPKPSVRALCGASFCLAIFPSTWQNFAVGQLGLPPLLFALLAARALTRNRFPQAVLFCLLALLKFTCSLPLLLYLFLKGDARKRRAIGAAFGLFLVLNLATAAHIGIHRMLAGYQEGIDSLFRAGATNDPGVGARMDADSLLAALPGGTPAVAAKAAAAAALVAAFLYGCRRSQALHLAEVSALSLLALLLFYHRTYDATLVFPALFLAWGLLRTGERSASDLLLMGGLLLCWASIGNHNLLDLLLRPLHLQQPFWWRSLAVLASFLALVCGPLQRARRSELAFGTLSLAPQAGTESLS